MLELVEVLVKWLSQPVKQQVLWEMLHWLSSSS